MKKVSLLFAMAVALLLASCGKNKDAFEFEGTVRGFVNCTMATATISEMDFGYVVEVSSPDSIGADYVNSEGKVLHNCVVLYRTRTRIYEDEPISGEMYLDDKYSRAYCSYHFDLGLPEAVCYRID